jgi:hypothetical protein
MFAVFVPYASALPPPQGSPIDQLSWIFTLQVFYQPTAQRRWQAGSDPPDSLSILEQGRASVYDKPGISLSSLTRIIQFGHDLVVATQGQSQVLVDPASL